MSRTVLGLWPTARALTDGGGRGSLSPSGHLHRPLMRRNPVRRPAAAVLVVLTETTAMLLVGNSIRAANPSVGVMGAATDAVFGAAPCVRAPEPGGRAS